jgi:hypothetical protein
MSALTLSYFDMRGLLFLRYPRVQATPDACRSTFVRPSALNPSSSREVIGQIRHTSRTHPHMNPECEFSVAPNVLVRIRPFSFHLTRGEIGWLRSDLPSLLRGGAIRMHLLIQATGFRSDTDNTYWLTCASFGRCFL